MLKLESKMLEKLSDLTINVCCWNCFVESIRDNGEDTVDELYSAHDVLEAYYLLKESSVEERIIEADEAVKMSGTTVFEMLRNDVYDRMRDLCESTLDKLESEFRNDLKELQEELNEVVGNKKIVPEEWKVEYNEDGIRSLFHLSNGKAWVGADNSVMYVNWSNKNIIFKGELGCE